MYEELTPPEIETKKANKDNVKENNKKNAQENQKDTKENSKEDAKENIKENLKDNNIENTKANNMENMEDLIDQKKSDYKVVEQSNYIEHSLTIENGSAKWKDYEDENTLQNINIKMRPGELIAIVGQVGSGKTSLLNVILKELRLQEGSIQVCW